MIVRTANATHDDLTDADYREIYHELRDSKSLRGFATYLGSSMSHAVWAKYDRNEASLTRRMKNELRAKAGLTLLPPTVEESLHDVDADATVAVLDGEFGVIDRVVVGNQADPRWAALEPRPGNHRVRRRQVVRPCVTHDVDKRRERLGASWKEVIEAGLEAIERSAHKDHEQDDGADNQQASMT